FRVAARRLRKRKVYDLPLRPLVRPGTSSRIGRVSASASRPCRCAGFFRPYRLPTESHRRHVPGRQHSDLDELDVQRTLTTKRSGGRQPSGPVSIRLRLGEAVMRGQSDRNRIANHEGIALIEFVMVFGVAMLLLLCFLEYSRYLATQALLTKAAQDALS